MLSYSELETKRQTWLKENGKFCQELVQLAATLGTRIDDLPSGWRNSAIHSIFAKGSITVDIIMRGGAYISKEKGYEARTSLRVYVGQYQPVYVILSNTGNQRNDLWFVPGDWMVALSGAIQEMQEIIKKIETAALDNEAAILEKRLLIGVEGFG